MSKKIIKHLEDVLGQLDDIGIDLDGDEEEELANIRIQLRDFIDKFKN